VAVDQVLAGLVAVDQVLAGLVAVDQVAMVHRPWSAVRGPWTPYPPLGAQKTGRVAGCAGFSPVLHGQRSVKQF
jgi:hypothetical protein